jgi:NAD+ kinase
MQAFSSIGLISKVADPNVAPTLTSLVEYLTGRQCKVLLDPSSAAHLHADKNKAITRAELGAHCDLIVVIGGDGTLLDAARAVAPHGVPLLGVNLGRLGFMVDVLPAEMVQTLDAVFAGRYVREERLMLTARVFSQGQEHGPFPSLNEVVVRNRDFARVIEFDTYMDGNFISHHRADGIIIATPTGSTAYALSSGGPVLHPALNALTLVPICPHTLSDRPLVLDAQREIEIVIEASQATQALMTCDGQVHSELGGGDSVKIRRAERTVLLIHPPGYDYFKILRNKLHWGRSQTSAR